MNRRARRAHAALNRRVAATQSCPNTFRTYAELELHFGSPIRAISHHEAAHAVACALLGLPFGDVTLLPHPKLDRARWLSELPRAPIGNAVVALAGPLSDRRMEQDEGLMTDPSSNAGDVAAAKALGLCIVRPEFGPLLFGGNGGAILYEVTEAEGAVLGPWFARVQWLAQGLVDTAWPEISLAAVELLERRRLAPARVLEIASRCALYGRADEAVLGQTMGMVTP